MKLRHLSAFVSLSALFCGSAGAALTWETTQADLHPALSDKTAVAHFKFKNTGDKPVKILSVHPSCGCTTASLPHDVYAPNENGEITATFNIAGRQGVQKKTITVETDDKPEEPTILYLTTTIPQLLQVVPTIIYWSAKDVLTPKNITVTVGPEFPVEKLTVTSTDKSISTEVQPGPDKKTFQVVVKPTESGRPIIAMLKIEPDYPKDNHPTYQVSVRVDRQAVRAAQPSPATKSSQ